MKMRPRLVCECDGVPMFWIEDPRTDDTNTITIVFPIDGESRYFPWPTDDKGQPVNPWKTTLDFFNGVKSTGPEPAAEREETWRNRPPLL